MEIKYAMAAQPGSYHLTNGIPCQDKVYGAAGKEAVCIALADGAGSYEKSHFAAEAIVNIAAQTLADKFDSYYAMSDESLQEAIIEMCRTAVEEQYSDVIPSSTLLAFAKAPDGRSLTLHIGDGYILGTKEGIATVISVPENGEDDSHTYFVSGVNSSRHLRIQRDVGQEYTGVLLCSDGAGESLVQRQNGNIASAVRIIVQWTEKYPQGQVNSMIERELDELFRRHTADDMSIAVMSFIQDVPEPQESNEQKVLSTSRETDSTEVANEQAVSDYEADEYFPFSSDVADEAFIDREGDGLDETVSAEVQAMLDVEEDGEEESYEPEEEKEGDST